MSLYGINPIKDTLIERSADADKIKSEIPMLMFNNEYLLNKDNVKITTDWIQKTFYKNQDNFNSHQTTKLGSFTSNMSKNFYYKHSPDYPQNRVRDFGQVQRQYMEEFMTKHTKDLTENVKPQHD